MIPEEVMECCAWCKECDTKEAECKKHETGFKEIWGCLVCLDETVRNDSKVEILDKFERVFFPPKYYNVGMALIPMSKEDWKKFRDVVMNGE